MGGDRALTAVRSSRTSWQVAACVAAFAVAETAFRFWLFFPGFFQFSDWMTVTLPGSVDWHYANHGQVLFISFVLRVFYGIFGYHTWYVLLLNLVLWHAGLAAVVLAVYRATLSRHALWLLLMTFWPGVWFYLPLYWKDFTFGLFLWLASGMCLLATTFGPARSTRDKVWRRGFWALVAVVLFCALYWRHNAIVTVTPLCLYLAHKMVMAKGNRAFASSGYLARVGLVFCALCICQLVLVVEHPALLGKPGQKGRFRQILLQDLVGISVISGHDLIPEAAYQPGVTFADIRKRYATAPSNADRFVFGKDRLLDETGPARLTHAWVEGIRRYPTAYLRHKARFARSLLLTRPWLPAARGLEADMRIRWTSNTWFTALMQEVMAPFPLRERKITFTPTRLRLCAWARACTRATNPRLIWYLGISVLGLVVGATRLARELKEDTCSRACDRVVLSSCLYLAAVATISIVIAFAPHTNFRYAFPAVTTSISATIALAFGLLRTRQKGP